MQRTACWRYAVAVIERDPAKMPLSPYAAELQRGSVSLRFPPGMEKEFRRSHLERYQSRVRIWQAALLAVGLISLLLGIALPGDLQFTVSTTLCVVVLLPASALLAWVAWSHHYFDRYLNTALWANVALMLASAWVVANAVDSGRPEVLVFLTTMTMGVFFVSGLLFFDSCLVNLLTILGFALTGVALGVASEKLVYHTAVLAAVVAIGAVTMWATEQTNRRFFLERGVLGDLAERDGLTGLRNRRAFDDHLLRVWQQSLRDRTALAVLMIDLDSFKNYNDAYGHQAGDTCLTQVSQMVQRFARRPLDIAARYGGEELAMVLYQVTTSQAQQIAEQVRDSIERMHIEHKGAVNHKVVTVSIGVSWAEVTFDRTPEALLQLADDALYAAKQSGRNAVHYLGPDHIQSTAGKMRRVPTRA